MSDLRLWTFRALTQLTHLSIYDRASSEVHVWFTSGLRSLSMQDMPLAPASWRDLSTTCRRLEDLDCMLYSMPPTTPQSLPRLKCLSLLMPYSGVVSWAAELASMSDHACLNLMAHVDATPLQQPAFHGLQLDTLELGECTAALLQNLRVGQLIASDFRGTCINAEALPSFLSTAHMSALHAGSMTVDLTGCVDLKTFIVIVKNNCQLRLKGDFMIQHKADRQFVTWLGAGTGAIGSCL